VATRRLLITLGLFALGAMLLTTVAALAAVNE